MTTFKLPDLGEGLPDAEISEWHVKVGDNIRVDEPLVSMETAKAVVDVPSPYSGKILRLHGNKGDVIKTGSPLVEFETQDTKLADSHHDQGTVVGNIDASGSILKESFSVGSSHSDTNTRILATPKVRQLAKKLNVSLDAINGTGPNGIITVADIEHHSSQSDSVLSAGYEPLVGARRQMSLNMTLAHQQVVPVTIFDDVDIHHWHDSVDITIRLIQAITAACAREPKLNAWFDGKSQSVLIHKEVHLGIALDTGEALFVPIIKNANTLDQHRLRETIDHFKQGARARSLSQQELHGATFTLSNFGNFAGRYASPIIVPPSVAILAVGRIRFEAVAYDGSLCIHKVLPLSLSFDHRAATGGEATRFLGCIIEKLKE